MPNKQRQPSSKIPVVVGLVLFLSVIGYGVFKSFSLFTKSIEVDIQGLREYRHPSGLFSIDLPSNWRLKEEALSAGQIGINCETPIKDGGGVIVHIDPPDSAMKGISPFNLKEKVLEKANIRNDVVLTDSEIQSDGKIILSMEGRYNNITYQIRVSSYVATSDGRLSTLIVGLPKDQWPKWKNKVDQIFTSYKVNAN